MKRIRVRRDVTLHPCAVSANGQCCLAHNPDGCLALVGRVAVVQPDNGTGGAAFNGEPRCQCITAVVDHCQFVLQRDQAFRGIGDAASVLFTAGYTDRLPDSLFGPAASLPLSVFFQLGTPFPAVQERAYASALVLTIIVLALSLISRGLASRFTKHIIR